MALVGLTNDEKIWNYFKSKGMSPYGIAGIIGNADFESALNPKNMEDAYQARLGYNDDTYTAAVDSGKYPQFVSDQVGYGLFQWTWWTRKQGLLELAKKKGHSVGDLETQLDYFYSELSSGFPSLLTTLMNARSVREASNGVLLKYEAPADTSVKMQDRRCVFAQRYYDKFAGKSTTEQPVILTAALTPVNGYYHFKKGSHIKLSKNFTSDEFDCHGSGCCSETITNVKLVEFCQTIRDHYNTSVSITSPYRCPVHNSRSNGATGSRHTKGDAADIVVSGHSPREVAAYCESIGILGVGLYETDSDGHFVHIDTRDYKSFWYGQAQAYRSTFGGTSAAQNNSSPATTSSGMLVSGSKGSAVKSLQEKLIKLGYSVGVCGADGEYGYGTMVAVRQFQKDHNLSQDGKCGSITLAAIDKEIGKLDGDNKNEYVVTASLLNVRSGAGTSFGIVKQVHKNTVLEITEINNGWGKMESGWVSMQYVQQKG